MQASGTDGHRTAPEVNLKSIKDQMSHLLAYRRNVAFLYRNGRARQSDANECMLTSLLETLSASCRPLQCYSTRLTDTVASVPYATNSYTPYRTAVYVRGRPTLARSTQYYFSTRR